MPRSGKEKKHNKNTSLEKYSSGEFHYPSINFAFLPRNNDAFAYKIEELIPGVLVCDDVFSQEECKILVQSCKGFLEPTNKNNARPKKGEAFRNNERYLHANRKENKEFAQKLWNERLSMDDMSTTSLL